jgi:hypothetical protein
MYFSANERIVRLLLSYTQCHDRVDYIVPVVFQSFDGLLPTDVGLCHDEFDILRLQAAIVDLLIIIIVFLRLLVLNSLALALVFRVIVAGVVSVARFGSSELLGSSGLMSRVEVLDLGLAKDAALVSRCEVA